MIILEYKLWKMTWEEAKSSISSANAILLPVGSMEQHGYHMTLDTDTYTSKVLAEKIAQEAQKRDIYIVVAPPLTFGVSWYHMDFPGTITFSQKTFIAAVLEILKSIHKHGYKNIIIFNSHGGNSIALQLVINLFYEQFGEIVYLAQWWEIANDVLMEIDSGYLHSEEAETSLLMYLGQRVLKDKTCREAFSREKALRKGGKSTSKWIRYDGLHKGPFISLPMNRIIEISKSGVVGDAKVATIEKGEKIAETVINRIVEICYDLGNK